MVEFLIESSLLVSMLLSLLRVPSALVSISLVIPRLHGSADLRSHHESSPQFSSWHRLLPLLRLCPTHLLLTHHCTDVIYISKHTFVETYMPIKIVDAQSMIADQFNDGW